MAALEQRGLPVPRAVDHNRHAVLMSLIDAYPLTQVPHLCPPACLIPPVLNQLLRSCMADTVDTASPARGLSPIRSAPAGSPGVMSACGWLLHPVADEARFLMYQVRELRNPGEVYTKLMDFMERLAGLGLIHCDFNEFNVMVRACCRNCAFAGLVSSCADSVKLGG